NSNFSPVGYIRCIALVVLSCVDDDGNQVGTVDRAIVKLRHPICKAFVVGFATKYVLVDVVDVVLVRNRRACRYFAGGGAVNVNLRRQLLECVLCASWVIALLVPILIEQVDVV